MQTTSHVQLTINGLPYHVLFVLDWGDNCPMFEEDREVIHRHLSGIFASTKRDTVPEHITLIEVK